MNKKIYFNQKFIEVLEGKSQSPSNQLIKIFDLQNLNKTVLKKIINDFLCDEKNLSIAVVIGNFNEFFDLLKTQFYYIEAAGGFIEKENEFLFIHRHGRWDLPKGKLEKDERVEEGAIRECEEECGVKKLKIKKPLNSTFHIYAYKDGFALKQTFWFYMQTDFSGKLVPQLEEDIDEVKFFSKKEILETVLNDTYFTISDVVREAMGNL